MRNAWILFFALFAVSVASFGQGTPSKAKEKKASTKAAPEAPTEIEIVEGLTAPIKVVVPLGNGATLPLKYTLKTEGLETWLNVSEAGELKPKQAPKLSDPEIRATYEVEDYNKNVVASFPIVVKVVASQTVRLGATPQPTLPVKKPEQTAITAEPIYDGGDTLVGKARAEGPVEVLVTHGSKTNKYRVDTQPDPDEDRNQQSNTAADTQAAKSKQPAAGSFALEMSSSVREEDQIQISQGGDTLQTTVHRPWLLNGEETRAIVGMQAAGASSSDQDQNFFFDMFIARPISHNKGTVESAGSFKWWGNVRVASYPQANISNQTVTEATTNFATNIGSLKLNQLAQGAEFLTGFEYTFLTSKNPFRGRSEKSLQKFSLGAIGAIGATGFFNSPSKNVAVFVVPQPGDSQYPTFHKEYPNVTSQYIGITTADYQQFPKEWLVGLRMTTNYLSMSGEPLRSAPAMASFSVGQNQLITGSHFSGAVGRIEAFYPLPIGQRTSKFSGIYLFGSVQMRLTNRGASELPPLVLQSAPSTVNPYDPSVAIVAVPNVRDVYRLGVGIDFVQLLSQWTKPSGQTKSKAPEKAAASPGDVSAK